MKKLLLLFTLLLACISCAYAAEDYVPGDVIVVLRKPSAVSAATSTAQARANASAVSAAFAESENVNVLAAYDSLSAVGDYIFLTVHSDTKDAKELLAEIKSRPDVAAASLNKIVHLSLPKALGHGSNQRTAGMEQRHRLRRRVRSSN